jgi:VanZ family protein
MALIFYLSAQPDPGPDVGGVGRVVAHFGEYALLTALWAWALAPALGRRAIAAAAAIALVYAVTDEYHQSFVEGRDADALDVLVDALGVAAAVIALSAWRASSRRPSTSR